MLPDGRVIGLGDAMAVIRAFYIGHPGTLDAKRSRLYELSPRDFERLAERLYNRMGYKTVLTPPARDGGRDVLADRDRPGEREHVRVDAKLYQEPVGVRIPRTLLGVVSDEKVNKGVVITPSTFTRGAQTYATRVASSTAIASSRPHGLFRGYALQQPLVVGHRYELLPVFS